jgi:hypothetical protein
MDFGRGSCSLAAYRNGLKARGDSAQCRDHAFQVLITEASKNDRGLLLPDAFEPRLNQALRCRRVVGSVQDHLFADTLKSAGPRRVCEPFLNCFLIHFDTRFAERLDGDRRIHALV